jgi:hypothetical protein
VVTTRLQTGRETTKKDDEVGFKTARPKQKGILQVVQEIYQEGGLKAFWNGLVPSLILVINPALQYMVRVVPIAPMSRLLTFDVVCRVVRVRCVVRVVH